MVESSLDKKVSLLTYSEVEKVEGSVGNFDVTIRKKARFIDESKCTGCGLCVEKCPSKVKSEFNMNLGTRKAIYSPFPTAVPNTPVIDKENCRFFIKGKCKACLKFCPAKAIDFEQEDEIIKKKFGVIIVATGYSLFDAKEYGEYGGGRYQNVITGLHFERMLDTSGPTNGHIIRPKDGQPAKRVVFIQCVGSRDRSKGIPYCSGICCMYTAKHALLLKDHVPDSQAYVFYIDIRATGKNYEEFINKVQRDYGAIYIRGRVSRIYEKGDIMVVKGADTLSGTPVEVEADLVVLATAIKPQENAIELAQTLGIPYDQYGFYSEAHPKLRPVESVTRGIYLTGVCQSPRDIPDSVATSGSAAVRTCEIFSRDRLSIEPIVAVIDQDICSGCQNCISVCPFEAIKDEVQGSRIVSKVNESLCQGCGTCVATCTAGALTLRGFTDAQIYSQINASFSPLTKEVTVEKNSN